MSWGIDEVDEKPIAILLLSDECQITVRQLIVQGDCTVGGRQKRVTAVYTALIYLTPKGARERERGGKEGQLVH